MDTFLIFYLCSIFICYLTCRLSTISIAYNEYSDGCFYDDMWCKGLRLISLLISSIPFLNLGTCLFLILVMIPMWINTIWNLYKKSGFGKNLVDKFTRWFDAPAKF